jgi:hypothetical protein
VIDSLTVLRAFEGLSLVVGSIIAVQSFRAYARSRQPTLLLLGLGFLLISLAAALAGVFYELLTHDLLTAWVISASLNSVGFLVILASLLRRSPEPAPAEP